MFSSLGIIATVGSYLSGFSPLIALAGGPFGIIIAWFGSTFAHKGVKIILVCVGIAVLVIVSVGFTIRIEHLEREEAQYKALSAEHVSLEKHYGCDKRPVFEQDLSACLTARDRDAVLAQEQEIKRQRDEAAREQSRLDQEASALNASEREADQQIDSASPTADGKVPNVLLDAWKRERIGRGRK